MEHELRQFLLRLAAAFTGATGRSSKTIGKKALNDNKFYPRIERGDGFSVKTYDRVVQWLSDNWPREAIWPREIPRPAPGSTPSAGGAE